MPSKLQTLMSWKRDANFGVYGPDNEFVAEFTHDADAAYAVKAANMHERLVEMLRLRAFAASDRHFSNRCIQCGALGSAGKPRHNEVCALAALLKEADDAS